MKSHEQLPVIRVRSGRGAWLEEFGDNRHIDLISVRRINLFDQSDGPTDNNQRKNGSRRRMT